MTRWEWEHWVSQACYNGKMPTKESQCYFRRIQNVWVTSDFVLCTDVCYMGNEGTKNWFWESIIKNFTKTVMILKFGTWLGWLMKSYDQHFCGPSDNGITDLWYQVTIRSDLEAVSQEILPLATHTRQILQISARSICYSQRNLLVPGFDVIFGCKIWACLNFGPLVLAFALSLSESGAGRVTALWLCKRHEPMEQLPNIFMTQYQHL